MRRRASRSRAEEMNNSIELQVFCHVTGFTSDFLSFIVVEHIRFFHGALQLILVSIPCGIIYKIRIPRMQVSAGFVTSLVTYWCGVAVCRDLMQNPLIVPVKILRCHSSTERNDVGVLGCEFHPTQPWILTCGVDNTLKLFT